MSCVYVERQVDLPLAKSRLKLEGDFSLKQPHDSPIVWMSKLGEGGCDYHLYQCQVVHLHNFDQISEVCCH